MVDIRKRKFQNLVGNDTASIGKSKQRVVRKASAKSHCPSMENSLVA